MIVGIGTDIVQIPRIEKILAAYGTRFIKKILSKLEIKKLSSLNEGDHANFLAKRFAAKEAISKAFGVGIGRENLRFQDISVLNDTLGKPVVTISSTKNSKKIKCLQVHISLSDDYPVAIAMALIVNKI